MELTADLCNQYGLDPSADGVVICHSEGYTRGVASNHADVMHWFPKFGKSMDTFRNDVAREMNGGDNLTEEDVRSIVRSELERIEANKGALGPSPWAASGLAAAVSSGITDGTRPQCNATRQEVALMVQAGLKLAK